MTRDVFLMVVHEVLSFALWYSVFCRSVRTDARVRTDVRLAFMFLGSVGLLAMVAPAVWGWEPDPITCLLVLAIVVVQWVTAVHWDRGVPEQYLRCEHRPRRRRASDCVPSEGCKP